MFNRHLQLERLRTMMEITTISITSVIGGQFNNLQPLTKDTQCCLKWWETWILHNRDAFKPTESVEPAWTCHQADWRIIFFSRHNIRQEYRTELISHHLLLAKLQPIIAGHWVWQPHTPPGVTLLPLWNKSLENHLRLYFVTVYPRSWVQI